MVLIESMKNVFMAAAKQFIKIWSILSEYYQKPKIIWICAT